MAGQKRLTKPHKPPTIEILVFDIDNKIMFQSRGSYLLSYPNFFTEQKTLIAGIYTIMVKPMWEDDGETSNTNKADYRKILVGIYYPRNAEFGKICIVDGQLGGLDIARGMRQVIKDNIGKSGSVPKAIDLAPSLYGSFGKRSHYMGYGGLTQTNIQTYLYENLDGATKEMAFRQTIDSNKIVFCIPQSMSDETQVQIVDCKGTYEVIVPANSDCLVMSIIKDKRPEKPEVFEWIM